MKKPTILCIAGGFYFFGDECAAPEGYVAITSAAMFGGFGGGLGLPGVARGAAGATVTLDRFAPADVQMFPISAVYGIFTSVDLYAFPGTTVRGA